MKITGFYTPLYVQRTVDFNNAIVCESLLKRFPAGCFKIHLTSKSADSVHDFERKNIFVKHNLLGRLWFLPYLRGKRVVNT